MVPGVFAEFIANRAFEEVLSKAKSPARDQFKALVAAQKISDSVSLVENYRENRPPDEVAPSEVRTLDQVINVSEMQINGASVRVILFFTEFSSLESLGDNASRAQIFNRRLEKYLGVTGDQDLAFVGYSRGTPLALEMLAQAKAANRPWVQNVKAMISLSGVTMGSSLADGAYYDVASPMNNILMSLQSTVKSLQPIDESQFLLSSKNRPIFGRQYAEVG